MINPKIEKQFIKWLYQDYNKRFGYGSRNIEKCVFYTTYLPEQLPKEFYTTTENVTKTHILDYAQELESKGLVKFSTPGTKFHFTKAGYDTASKGFWNKLFEMLNKNPGLCSAVAIGVSVCSLIVAIVSLNKQ